MRQARYLALGCAVAAAFSVGNAAESVSDFSQFKIGVATYTQVVTKLGRRDLATHHCADGSRILSFWFRRPSPDPSDITVIYSTSRIKDIRSSNNAFVDLVMRAHTISDDRKVEMKFSAQGVLAHKTETIIRRDCPHTVGSGACSYRTPRPEDWGPCSL